MGDVLDRLWVDLTLGVRSPRSTSGCGRPHPGRPHPGCAVAAVDLTLGVRSLLHTQGAVTGHTAGAVTEREALHETPAHSPQRGATAGRRGTSSALMVTRFCRGTSRQNAGRGRRGLGVALRAAARPRNGFERGRTPGSADLTPVPGLFVTHILVCTVHPGQRREATKITRPHRRRRRPPIWSLPLLASWRFGGSTQGVALGGLAGLPRVESIAFDDAYFPGTARGVRCAAGLRAPHS